MESREENIQRNSSHQNLKHTEEQSIERGQSPLTYSTYKIFLLSRNRHISSRFADNAVTGDKYNII